MPTDILTWPICQQDENANSSEPHLRCEVTSRPCCFGIQAICIITTREQCDFLDGRFHQEAFLCSQVNGGVACNRGGCRAEPPLGEGGASIGWSLHRVVVDRGWSLHRVGVARGWSLHRVGVARGWSLHRVGVARGWSLHRVGVEPPLGGGG